MITELALAVSKGIVQTLSCDLHTTLPKPRLYLTCATAVYFVASQHYTDQLSVQRVALVLNRPMGNLSLQCHGLSRYVTTFIDKLQSLVAECYHLQMLQDTCG